MSQSIVYTPLCCEQKSCVFVPGKQDTAHNTIHDVINKGHVFNRKFTFNLMLIGPANWARSKFTWICIMHLHLRRLLCHCDAFFLFKMKASGALKGLLCIKLMKESSAKREWEYLIYSHNIWRFWQPTKTQLARNRCCIWVKIVDFIMKCFP